MGMDKMTEAENMRILQRVKIAYSIYVALHPFRRIDDVLYHYSS